MHTRRRNSVKAYQDQIKKTKRKEAELENSRRPAEHKQENLLVTAINDNLSSNKYLSAMVKIFGKNSGMSDEKVNELVGDSNDDSSPLPLPPPPNLIVISDSEEEADYHEPQVHNEQEGDNNEPQVQNEQEGDNNEDN